MFFSFYDLNKNIRSLLEDINNKPFQKMEGTRRSMFESIDRPALIPLPSQIYEFAIWKHAKVNIDYHIEFEKKLYSVPYQLIGQEVDLRITEKVIEVIHNGKRVTVHPRLRGTHREYSTISEHMPLKHQKMIQWNPERIINWSKTIGPNTSELISKLMDMYQHPEVAFRAWVGIIRLADKYTAERVENASIRALKCRAISYKSIESILKNGLDKIPFENPTETQPPISHENIRGIGYFAKEVN